MLLQSPLYKVVEIRNPKITLVKRLVSKLAIWSKFIPILTRIKLMSANKGFTLSIARPVLPCEQLDLILRPSQLKSELKLYQTSQCLLKQKLNLKLALTFKTVNFYCFLFFLPKKVYFCFKFGII